MSDKPTYDGDLVVVDAEHFNAKHASDYLGEEWVVRASDYDRLRTALESAQSELELYKASNDVLARKLAEAREHIKALADDMEPLLGRLPRSDRDRSAIDAALDFYWGLDKGESSDG